MFDTLRAEDPVHWNHEPTATTTASGRSPATRTSRRWTRTARRSPPTSSSTSRSRRRAVPGPAALHARDRRRPPPGAAQAARSATSAPAQLRRYEDFLRGLARDHRRRRAARRRSSTSSTTSPRTSRSTCWPGCSTYRTRDPPQLIDWGNEIVGYTDPDCADVLLDSDGGASSTSTCRSARPSSLEIFEYGRELAKERRGGDGDDLVSKLVNRMPEDGVPLSDTDFDNYFLLLVVAGNETTRQAISTR